MLPATVSAPAADPAALLAAYAGHLRPDRARQHRLLPPGCPRVLRALAGPGRTGRPSRCGARLSADQRTRPFITFLMLHGAPAAGL